MAHIGRIELARCRRWTFVTCLLSVGLLTGCPTDTEVTERMLPEYEAIDCDPGYVQVGESCVVDLNQDMDRDGVPDLADNCPVNSNAPQTDCDLDGIGDACDEDFPCEAMLVGDVFTVRDDEPTLELISGGMVRLEPSGRVADISFLGRYQMSIPIGTFNIQVFSPQEVLRYNLQDSVRMVVAGDGDAGNPSDSDENQENPEADEMEPVNEGSEVAEEPMFPVIETLPEGLIPLHEEELEVGINNMNEVVFHNVVIGELGRLAGRVCLADQPVDAPAHGGVTVSIEPMDGEGEAWTVTTDASGFFFSGQLYVGEYSVTFEKTFYQSTFVTSTVEAFRDTPITDEGPCSVSLEPI